MRASTAPFTLRAARPEDGAAVAEMCAALSRHEGGPAPALTAAAFRRDGFGPNPSFSCVIAEQAGRPAGYAMHLGDYDTDLMCHGTYLADLYVDTGARRCGIGRALMAAVARITRERGGRFVRWNVLRSNPSARAFYRTVGEERDHLVMYSVGGGGLAALAGTAAPAGLGLRQAVAADVPTLGALLGALLVNEGFDPSPFDLAARIAADGFGERPAFTCHLAERDGRTLGYAMHWPTYDTEPAARCGYLSDLYVLPEGRRGGVARALMGAVARHWTARQAPWIEWEVRRENATARAFYATIAHEYPDVLPVIAAGDDFTRLAAAGAAMA